MRRIVLAIILGCVSNTVQADDWPQWLGPKRDAHWRETGIVEAFPDDGMEPKWRVPVSGGYSGPAVADEKVFITDYLREAGETGNDPRTRNKLTGKERVICLDARTGNEIWTHDYDCAYEISYPAGPRTTPAVDGDRVYSLGAEGNLICLNVDNGDVVWKRELKEDYETNSPLWGFSAHPLVDGDKLFCVVGGKGSVAVAFNKKTGEEIWRALSASESGYCPPLIIEAAGVRQLIIWDADKVNGLNPENGEVFWSVPLKPSYGMSIAQPIRHENLLFASGIGNIGAAIKLDTDKPTAEIEWRASNKMACFSSNTTPIVDESGTVYGVDCGGGHLRAFDIESGDRLWDTLEPTTGARRAPHGTAFIVRNGNRYFLFAENGDLVMAKMSKEGYEELGRIHLLEPTGEAFGRDVVWSHPAFAMKCVFARNDKEIVCVSLAASD